MIAGQMEDCRSIDGSQSSGRTAFPQGLALDEDAGVLYIAETTALRALSLTDGSISTVGAITIGALGGLLKHPTEARLFASRRNSHTIVSIDLSQVRPTISIIAGTASAAGSADGMGTNASFRSPRGLTTDG